MSERVHHALLTPWPVSSGLFTWCGMPAAGAGGEHRVVAKPGNVTCAGCRRSMREALAQLQSWVPKLSEGGDE